MTTHADFPVAPEQVETGPQQADLAATTPDAAPVDDAVFEEQGAASTLRRLAESHPMVDDVTSRGLPFGLALDRFGPPADWTDDTRAFVADVASAGNEVAATGERVDTRQAQAGDLVERLAQATDDGLMVVAVADELPADRLPMVNEPALVTLFDGGDRPVVSLHGLDEDSYGRASMRTALGDPGSRELPIWVFERTPDGADTTEV